MYCVRTPRSPLLVLQRATYVVFGKGRCCEPKGTRSLSILSLLTLGNLYNACMPPYFFLSFSFIRFHFLVQESSPQTVDLWLLVILENSINVCIRYTSSPRRRMRRFFSIHNTRIVFHDTHGRTDGVLSDNARTRERTACETLR